MLAHGDLVDAAGHMEPEASWPWMFGARHVLTAPVMQWLNAERAAKGSLTVALRQPQYIAHQTPGVGYHWYADRMGFEDACAFTKHLGVDYVVIGSKTPTFATRPAFSSAFELAATVGRTRIYRAVPDGACAP